MYSAHTYRGHRLNLLLSINDHYRTGLLHMSSFQFEVPAKYQRIIIGQRGQNLKRVESKTGVFNIRIVPGPTEVQYIYTPWQLHISVIWDITINHASAHALADG